MKKLKFASLFFLASTLLLKFSSMIRDILIASLFGDSYHADVYFAAMTIPNAFILFLLTGMKDAFLPSYYKYDAIGQGKNHLTNIVKGTFVITLVLSIIFILLSPTVIQLFYPNFANFEQGVSIAVWTAAIYFASLSIVGVNSVYEGFFDAKKKFSFSVFSQTSVVLTTIAITLLLHKQLGIISVSVGYLLGTFISFFIKFFYIGPKNFLNYKQKMNIPEIKSFYAIFIPVGLTIAVGQINLLVNMFFAAKIGVEGVVANLNYAFRLVSIPQAIFAVTIATIVFPYIAEAYNRKQFGRFKKGLENGILLMLMLITPAIMGMVYLMPQLVELIYERGKFTPETTTIVSSYSIFYIGSTFFYSIQAVIAKGFYTMEKGHYMMRIGFISVLLNVISNAVFSYYWGAQGIALSASVVALLYSLMSFTTLSKNIKGFDWRYLFTNTSQIVVSTLMMFIGIHFLNQLTAIGKLPNLVFILLVALVGASIYFITLFLFNNQLLKQLKKN